jgi:exodeoxyribonuclease-3
MNAENPDIMAFQETKMQEDQFNFNFDGYFRYMNSAERKGSSGTMVLTKIRPLSVSYDIKGDDHPKEGRVITLEYEDFYFVCAYVPNSKDGLLRLDYRMHWEDDLRKHLLKLDKKKPIIYTGDLNVAHNEIDLKNPETNHFSAGFSDEERGKFTVLLESGFKDTFRELYPETVKYSWWSYRARARERNAGWRIDYFVVSNRFMDKVKDSVIYDEIEGSDHCPIGLII